MMLEAATEFACRGWPVFPLNGKVPRTEHGVLDATLAHNVLRATMQGLQSLHDVARVARIRGKSVEEIQQEMDR